MANFSKFGLAIGTAAVLATSVTPAAAAVSLGNSKSVLKAAGEYEGWRRGRYRHRDRVDGGDILAGLAVLAGIAIVADAASKSREPSRMADRYPSDGYPQDNRDNVRVDQSNDVGRAIEACSLAAQRDGAQVEEIRSVTRDGAGWLVEGMLSNRNDDRFTCGATDGEVDFVQFNGSND